MLTEDKYTYMRRHRHSCTQMTLKNFVGGKLWEHNNAFHANKHEQLFFTRRRLTNYLYIYRVVFPWSPSTWSNLEYSPPNNIRKEAPSSWSISKIIFTSSFGYGNTACKTIIRLFFQKRKTETWGHAWTINWKHEKSLLFSGIFQLEMLKELKNRALIRKSGINLKSAFSRYTGKWSVGY